jgi:hypothetical protein
MLHPSNGCRLDRVNYNQDLDSPLFGTIDKSSVHQSGFPRQVQLGVKLLW